MTPFRVCGGRSSMKSLILCSNTTPLPSQTLGNVTDRGGKVHKTAIYQNFRCISLILPTKMKFSYMKLKKPEILPFSVRDKKKIWRPVKKWKSLRYFHAKFDGLRTRFFDGPSKNNVSHEKPSKIPIPAFLPAENQNSCEILENRTKWWIEAGQWRGRGERDETRREEKEKE